MERARRVTGTTADSICECYINTAEIKRGRWQEDPSECLRNCKEHFLRSVLQSWGESSGWVDGCRILNRAAPARDFWSLYWCDSTFCGVGISQTGGLGQDRDIGFYSVLDPGPPAPDFRCNTEADTTEGCSFTVMGIPGATKAPLPNTTQQPISANSALPTTTRTQVAPNPAVVASAPSSARSVATERSSSTTAAGTASTTSGSNLTGQGKAAVAICSVLALMLLVTFALVWLRRRKRRKAAFDRALRSRRGPTQEIPPAGSPTPLISPANSAVGTRTVLTPPLRLRDRKFLLPSILRQGSRSPSPPLTPLTPAYGPQPGGGNGGSSSKGSAIFPSSPICSPTTTKLTTGIPPLLLPSLTGPDSTLSLPIPVPGSWPAEQCNRASASASSCYTATGTSTAHSSLRHEIPIGIPFQASSSARDSNNNSTVVGGGAGGTGSGSSSSTYSTPPPPPPPPRGSPSLSSSQEQIQLMHSSQPPPPPYHYHHQQHQQHHGPRMLEIPDLLTPAPSGGGNVGTPPPPPPVSPPPTKALPPRPPPPPPPPPRGSGKGRARSAAVAVGIARGSGLGSGSSLPGSTAGMFHHHYDHRALSGPHHPRKSESESLKNVEPEPDPDPRGSWGSWSGAGACYGDAGHGSITGRSVMGNGEGGGAIMDEDLVSPRTSDSSDVTATGGTLVSAVSRMSSTREGDDNTIAGRI
ncbi:hypothetical protein C8A03DRAFT_40457 [Achaetomium macrosporum]|uniref:Uncharacterized protein n=1 Tax=Achaetomium macrosporum TaxID=79813 RepID=A0AAN7CJX9_9PEZI|nr:hypothetical protein C8A03DRAFT_40457 [Achaetomium macrosporum]